MRRKGDYLVERGVISVIRGEPCQSCEFLAVFVILHCTQFKNGAIGFLHLVNLGLVVSLRNRLEKLNHVFEDNIF